MTAVIKRDRTPKATTAFRRKMRRAMVGVGKELRKEIRSDINRKTPTEYRGTKEYPTTRAIRGEPPRRVTGRLWRSVKRKTRTRRGRVSLYIRSGFYGRFLETRGRRNRRQGNGDHPFITPVIEKRLPEILRQLTRASRGA